MTRVVLVHGIGHQHEGPETLLAAWLPALQDGLTLAGSESPSANEVALAFYGDLYRPAGNKTLGDPPLDATDVERGFEQELLFALWEASAAVEPEVPGPNTRTKWRTPGFVQRALAALSGSRFFADVLEATLIFDLKQVSRYFQEPAVRQAIQERLAACVDADTRVLVGHSLGSVVAYEALCAHPEWRVTTLVTLGSPLGVRNLIFDRLIPAPDKGVGAWPGGVQAWTNIADRADVVALVKGLRGEFGQNLVDVLVHNGARAHDARPYLTAVETGRAIAAGLVS